MDKVDRARVLEAFNDREAFAAFLQELHDEWRSSNVTFGEYKAGQALLDDRTWMTVRLMLALSDLADLRTDAHLKDARITAQENALRSLERERWDDFSKDDPQSWPRYVHEWLDAKTQQLRARAEALEKHIVIRRAVEHGLYAHGGASDACEVGPCGPANDALAAAGQVPITDAKKVLERRRELTMEEHRAIWAEARRKDMSAAHWAYTYADVLLDALAALRAEV